MKPDFFGLRSLAFSWLVIVAVIIVVALRQGLVFDSSILSLLPKSDQQPLVQYAADQLSRNYSQRLIILVSGARDEKVRDAVASMASDLVALPDISKVYWRVENDELARFRNDLFPYRFSVLDADTRKSLLAKNYQQVGNQALTQLFGPVSIGKNAVIADPFGLYLKLSKNRINDLNLQISNSLLKITGTENPTYMLVLTLDGDPFTPGLQQRVLDAIATQQDSLSRSVDNINMSGMLLHAAAGAKQAKNEISTIGFGSLAGIVIAILVVFRRFKPLLLIALPIVVGCIFASAMVLIVFGKVHLVTFAFGAGLVGVSIDYSLHYLCERRMSKNDQVLRKILAGLLLGLFSSVMAYAAQALTPFPGLRQMATFSVAGLCASWLTVVLCFPLLSRGDSEEDIDFSHKLNRLRKLFPRIEQKPLLALLLVVPLVLAINSVWTSNSLDDIRLLQTSPANLLLQEKNIHQILGIGGSSRFLLVSSDTLEQCLQKEEKLVSALEKMKRQGLIGGYQALSSSLPSLERQAENIKLVRKLYDSQLASFYAIAKLAENSLIDASTILEEAGDIRLTPAIWWQAASESGKSLVVMQSESSAATVIRFTGVFDNSAKPGLKALSTSIDGVSFIDQVENISELLGKYRVQITNWVVLAYLFVLFVLLLRYKRQVWRVVLPPLLASIFTLAILVQLEQGLNLFHLMALILVLGIGLDMGIFLMETDEAPHTWLAVSLSAYTSLLAFGLLALSDTPVLHHFGLTIAIGLTLVWLLVPLMRRN